MADEAAKPKTLCQRRLVRYVIKNQTPPSIRMAGLFCIEKAGTILKSTEKDVIGSIAPALLLISSYRDKSLGFLPYF